jgi:hypothetical protein
MDINNVKKFLNLDSAKLNYISKLDHFENKNNGIYIQDNFEQKDLYKLQGHLNKKPILILINSGNEDEYEDENENNTQKPIDDKEIIKKETITESQYNKLSTNNKNLYEKTNKTLPDGPNQVVYLYKKIELIEKEKEENIKKILAKSEITKDEYNMIPDKNKKSYDEITKQERGKNNETDIVTVYKLKTEIQEEEESYQINTGGNTKKRKQKKAKRRRSSKKRNRT